MCGICGLIASDGRSEVGESVLRRMMAVLEHRGPDDEGLYGPRQFDGLTVGLGHRRLSIIDLATGHQPMSNEDGTIWLVFNGEIYNYRELRRDLTARGHVFSTQSDTEVIVHLYEEHGADCVTHLRGMFAIALWDETKRQLFAARDRLGQKPFFYRAEHGVFAFGSEIKSILEVPGVAREVDAEALHHYLTYQYVPHPWTMFRGIRKLPPAHRLTWRDGCVEIDRYWALKVEPDESLTEERCAQRLRDLVFEATELRLISDVPLGAFLSGGIDSSIIVAVMSQFSREPVRTFSIGFEEAKYNELAYARLVAERFKTDHHEFIVRPDAVETLPTLAWHFDEPFADSSALPTYYVSKLTSEHVKVALTGDAGDELFGGYTRYQAVKLSSKIDRLPALIRHILAGVVADCIPPSIEQKTIRRRLKRFLSELAIPADRRYGGWVSVFSDAGKRDLYTPELSERLAGVDSFDLYGPDFSRFDGLDPVSAVSYVDQMNYLPGDLLTKVDIASMANSLETRSPFLDHKVVEFAATIPAELKMRGFKGKYILKRAFADLLPRKIRRRGKMGFGVPVSAWLRGAMVPYARMTLLRHQRSAPYFQPDAVKALFQEHVTGRADHGARLWALLCFELWLRRFL